jgi:hypothetical protein
LQGLKLKQLLVQATTYLGLLAVSPEQIIEATPSIYEGGNIATYFAS